MRKSLVVIGIAVFLLTVYVVVLLPLEEKRALLREKIDADYARLLKYREYASGAQISKDGLSRAREELLNLEKGVIKQDQEPIAFAELQLRLQETAQKAGLAVLTLRPLKAEKQTGYNRLPIAIEAEGGIKQVSDFLKALDSGASYVKIETLEINNRDLRGEQKQLRVKMRISGLMKT